MDRNEDRKMTVEDAKAQLRFAARQADPANLLEYLKQNEVMVVAGAIVAGALLGYMLKPSGNKAGSRLSSYHGEAGSGDMQRNREPGKLAQLGAYIMQNVQQMLDEEMPQIKAALKDQVTQAVPQLKEQLANKMSHRSSKSSSNYRSGSEYTTSASTGDTGATGTPASAGSTSAH